MIVLIDNYDSFTFNLYQYLAEITDVIVKRNDEVSIDELRAMKLEGIVISPGPGRPEDAGITLDVIKELGPEVPILGICLGHEAIGLAYGGNVVKANKIYHGKSSKIKVKGNDLFQGINRKIDAMRYHSLIVEKETLPECLEIIGETIEDEVIMAVKHKEYKVFGVQFHPESIYTDKGKKIIDNFIQEVCYDYR